MQKAKEVKIEEFYQEWESEDNIQDKEILLENDPAGFYGVEFKSGTENWSYVECMEFTEYLVERFGIQKVTETNYEYDRFKEIFGNTMENLHQSGKRIF